ncbi:hypothetical protein EYF80_039371 [Liparis tanakae]|uniref:Uncharacterized protein n=1 Tax=Liparis tanakae TaxID=230148 RepID=A0A4Z2GBJ8_9TELE|nr:hypothetical protein EYF80_039371 [Liparis tanakae]
MERGGREERGRKKGTEGLRRGGSRRNTETEKEAGQHPVRVGRVLPINVDSLWRPCLPYI